MELRKRRVGTSYSHIAKQITALPLHLYLYNIVNQRAMPTPLSKNWHMGHRLVCRRGGKLEVQYVLNTFLCIVTWSKICRAIEV